MELMTAYPRHRVRSVQMLDGVWDFVYLGDDADLAALSTDALRFGERAAVPSVYDASPAYAGRRGTAVYRTFVASTPGTRARVHFHGLGLWCRVLVDGQAVAENSLPYSGFWADVPPAEQPLRELLVVVDNRFDPERVPLFEQFFDFYAYGGIYRSVEWHEVAPVCIERARVTTLDLSDGTIQVDVTLNGQDLPQSIDITTSIDGGESATWRDCKVVDGAARLQLRVPEPTLWSPSTPNLHTIQVAIEGDDIVERFGLRTVAASEHEILLNGEPVKLLGYCRHEAHPQFGPALPHAQLVQDLQLLRDLGCNFVRGSHYPQDPRFLDLCDELGFLVWEESLGWGQKAAHFERQSFCDAQVEQTTLMVRNSANHPCVIMWGFLNEGESNSEASVPLYTRLVETIRELDPTRLVTYATNRPFNDLNLALVDVVSVNCYPGWYASHDADPRPLGDVVPHIHRLLAHMAEQGLGDKPFILSEIGAGAIYGWRDPLAAHWSEGYQADYLELVCREAVTNDRVNGLALWQFCDCRTYASPRALGRPRAFNNKGTLDEYRRPKQAYETAKQVFRTGRRELGSTHSPK